MKATWKSFVSWILAALLAAAFVPAVALAKSALPLTLGTQEISYDLWVAGKRVTSANAANLSAIPGVSVAEGGVAKYDPENNTLYLKDATITAPNNSGTNNHGAINYNPSATSTFTIDVTGTCKAEWENDLASSTPYPSGFASGYSAKTRLHDGAVFTLKGAHSSANNPESYGIQVNGLLTVEGEGKLVAQGGENVSASRGIYALNLSVGDGCTVEASAGTAAESYGVELCGTPDSSFNTTINLAGSAALSCAGGTSDENSYGILCSNSAQTQSSTLTLDAPNWTGSFSTQGNTGAIGGPWGIEHFTISAGKRILLGYTAPNDDGVVLAPSSPPSKIYEIKDDLSSYKTIGTRGSLEGYDVWVGGTQVTNENAGDVFGDGKVKFAPATSEEPATLTLKGYNGRAAYFDKFDGISGALLGIYAKGDLAIELKKDTENIIKGSSSQSGNPTISAAIGVEGGDLTITGAGALKAAGLDNPEGGSIADSRGISVVNAPLSEGGASAGGTLTVTVGAKVTAIGGSVSAGESKSYGIVADTDLAVTGGAEIAATGGNAGSRSYGIVAGKIAALEAGALDVGAFTIDNGAVVVDFTEIGPDTKVRGINAGSLGMDNAGSVDIAVGEASVLTSLYVFGDVKVDNKSTISVTAEDMSSTTAGAQAGSLTADNESSIDITLGNSRSVTGMIVTGGMKLDNKSAIAVSGGNASSFNSVGLRASGSATIDNGSSLGVTLGNAGRKMSGFTSAALLMDGKSAVSVSTGNADANNTGMELPNGMAVDGGSAVTVTTGSAGGTVNTAITCAAIAEIEDGVVTASAGTGGFSSCGIIVNKGIKVGESATVKASAAGGATGLSAGVIVYDGDEDSVVSLGGRVSAEAGAGSGDESGSIGFAVEKGPEISPTGFFEARGHTRAVACVEDEAEDLAVSAAAVRAGRAYDGSDLADVESPFKATSDYKAVMAGAAFGIALKGSEFTYDGSAKYIENAPTSTAAKGTTSFSYSFEKDGAYVDDLSSLTNTDAGEHVVYVRAANPEYVSVATTTATLTIEPAKATITVAGASKVEGEADPAFTGRAEGLVEDGDLGKVAYKRTNSDEAPGTYRGVITAEYAENPNYDVAVVNGDFTIWPPVPDPNRQAPSAASGPQAAGAAEEGAASAPARAGEETGSVPASDGAAAAPAAGASAPEAGLAGKAPEPAAVPRTGDPLAAAPALAAAAAIALCLVLFGLRRRSRP